MTRAPDSETRAPALVWRRDWGEVRARSAPPGTRRGAPAPDAQTSRDEKGESPGNRNASGFSGLGSRVLNIYLLSPPPGWGSSSFKAGIYKHAINYSRGGAPVPPAGLAGTISGGISRMASLDERLMRRPAGPARVSRLTARSAPPSASRGTSRSSQRRRPERTLRSRVRRKKGERSET